MSYKAQALLTQAASLEGLWLLNEAGGAGSFADDSGKGRTLTITGAVTSGQDGVLGRSANFAGGTGYYAGAVLPAPSGGTWRWTMTWWAKITANDGTYMWSQAKTANSQRHAAIVGYTGFGQATNKYTAFIVDNTAVTKYGNAAGHAFGPINDGTWHMYSIVSRDGSASGQCDFEFYKDGVSLGTSGDVAIPTLTAPSHFSIGAFYDGAASSGIAGNMQGIGAWSSLLSTAEILALYQSANPAQIKPAGGGDFTTLQSWFDTIDTVTGAHNAECYLGGDLGALLVPQTATYGSIDIRAAAGQAHSLTLASGCFSTGDIEFRKGNVTVKQLRTSGRFIITTNGANVDNIIFDSLIAFALQTNPVAVGNGDITNCYWKNCVGTQEVNVLARDAGGTGAVTNVNVYHCFGGTGLYIQWNNVTATQVSDVANNIAGNYIWNVTGIGSITSENNLSADATADDFDPGGALINKPLANQVNNAANDWNIKSSADARDHGTNVGVSYDAIGKARPRGTTFDMGPAEFSPPGGAMVGWHRILP